MPTRRVESSFEITGWDQTPWHEGDDATLSTTSIRKRFAGGVVGTSRAETVMALDGAGGPLAYVGLERLEVTLDGRTGTFVLQHVAGPDGPPAWTILPGTGTGALAGITGHAEFVVEDDGGHSLTLDVELDG